MTATSVRAVQPENVELHCVAGDTGLGYYLYRPAGHGRDADVLVSVHGISRNAAAHAERLAPLARLRGALVVAPLFTRSRFPDYQRLGQRGDDAATALERILDDVTGRTGTATGRVRMFGYSGGAQFAHRYAMLHPERIRSLGLGAAGWYTFPDSSCPFPRGTGPSRGLGTRRLTLDTFLALPIRVFVGDRDCLRDGDLNRSPRVDREQGATRLERAARWVNAVRIGALAHGTRSDVRLRILPGGGHDFEQNVAVAGLDRHIFRELF